MTVYVYVCKLQTCNRLFLKLERGEIDIDMREYFKKKKKKAQTLECETCQTDFKRKKKNKPNPTQNNQQPLKRNFEKNKKAKTIIKYAHTHKHISCCQRECKILHSSFLFKKTKPKKNKKKKPCQYIDTEVVADLEGTLDEDLTEKERYASLMMCIKQTTPQCFGNVACYNPPPNNVLGCFGLSQSTDERTLRQTFQDFGRIDKVTLIMDRKVELELQKAMLSSILKVNVMLLLLKKLVLALYVFFFFKKKRKYSSTGLNMPLYFVLFFCDRYWMDEKYATAASIDTAAATVAAKAGLEAKVGHEVAPSLLQNRARAQTNKGTKLKQMKKGKGGENLLKD
ncbi:hypothetical protein RFI_11712 [Reticulomyxa filosa]|uniref:RRM domain-containing protein n=1 Tax=Reticulomyxa filosa TaxID=46433 RepID=X6NJB1_RETFI|nr:hypothetical protein RFI_11712 [Reticulomyxa filosa]|eukprot:ETO25422.1 hypothetical protein RFI_11712 [Reticulomyxa filosa]